MYAYIKEIKVGEELVIFFELDNEEGVFYAEQKNRKNTFFFFKKHFLSWRDG